MPEDKEHLFDKDEYQRQIKKEMSKLNSQQFSVAGPGSLGPEITTVGLKTNIEPISQKFRDVGFAIQDYGTIGFVSQNIDFDLLGAKYNVFDLNGDVTFGFLNFPLNRAEIFTVDISISTGTPPVIIWPSSVKNLPLNLPTASGSRYILHMAGYRNDNEEVYHVIGGSTGSILPAGTAENQHLEWDNTGLVWLAVSTSEYGATGPHADTGFLKFANDNIMTSQRNAADTGNLETKVTTLDAFDFTNSLNSTDVVLQIRAQHLTNPDAIFSIRQDFDDGASGDITTFTAPQSILFNVNASILMTIGPTEVDVQANLDMNLGNIREVTEIHGRDDATPFKIIFDIAEDGDTFISDDTATADRINITAGGVAFWSWLNDGTDKIAGITTGSDGILTISDGQLNMLARTVPPDADVANDEMTIYGDTATDPLRLLFKRKTVAGVASVGTFVYSPMDFTFDMGDNNMIGVNSISTNLTSGHDIGDTTFPFDEIHARKFLPSSATPTTGRPGFKRESDVLYIDMVDATGTFEIRENGDLVSGGFIFDNNGTASILTISNTSATLNLRDVVGDRATFVYDGNDLRIHADTGLSTQGIRLLTENADRIFITSTQILFSELLNMNALAITNTGTITPDVSDTYNLGAVGNRYAQLHVNTIAGAGQVLTLNSSLAIFNIDAGDEFQVQVGSGSVELQVQTDTIIFNAEVIADSTMRFAERTAPSAVANTAFIYSKDVSTVTHMFVMDSAGVETDLTVGGGGGGNEFSDALFRIFDNIDGSRKLAFQTGGIATATTRTWTVPNRDGTIVVIDGTTGDLEVGADINVTDFDVLNIKDLVGRDAGLNSFKVIFDGAEDSDTYFGDSGSTDRINVFAGGANTTFFLPTQTIINNVPLRFQGNFSLANDDLFSIAQQDAFDPIFGSTDLGTFDALIINGGSTAQGVVITLSGSNDEWYWFSDTGLYLGADAGSAGGATDGKGIYFRDTFISNFGLTDIVDNYAVVVYDQADHVLKVKKNIGGVLSTVSLEGAGGSGANVTLSNLSVTSINQDLRPSADGLRDLGISTLRWKDIFGEDLDIKSTFKTGEDETASNTVSFFGGGATLTHHNVTKVVVAEALSLTQAKVRSLQEALDDYNLVGA